MKRKEIRIAGFGGQGIVLSGSIIGRAASIHDDDYAALTQSYGPESRGGACRAEVVISDKPVDYPYLTKPDVQILLSQEAYNEFSKNVTEGNMVIIDSDLIKTDTSQNIKPLSIPASRMAREIGRPVVANIIVLGFLAATSNIVSDEALKKAILDSVPPGTGDFNMKAFDMGYNYGIEHGRKDKNRST